MTDRQPVTTDTSALPETASAAEAAAIICGDSVLNPEVWLTRKLRAGTIPGYKVGRAWRMTRADIDAALTALKPAPTGTPLDVLTPTYSTRQRVSAG
jgi:hypothetical protein